MRQSSGRKLGSHRSVVVGFVLVCGNVRPPEVNLVQGIAHDLATMSWIGIVEFFIEMIDEGEKALLGVGMKRAVFVARHAVSRGTGNCTRGVIGPMSFRADAHARCSGEQE